MSKLDLPAWPNEPSELPEDPFGGGWLVTDALEYERARAEAALARLRYLIPFAHHDYECPVHVLNWPSPRQPGGGPGDHKCDCGLDEALAAIGEVPQS